MNMARSTSATFLLMLFFINFLFGYQILLDLNRGYALTHKKLLAIAATSTIIVLGALAIIAYQLLKHGYTLRDIKRIHIILLEEDIKRQKDSLAKLRWGFVDWILWAILAANGAILFVVHHIIIGSQILDVAGIFAVMMSRVMLYAPLVFLFLYPVGRLFEKDFPFDSPLFFLSFGFLCLILTLISYEKLEKIWWEPLLVSFSWIIAGFISFFAKNNWKFEILSFAVLLVPLTLLSFRCPAAILPALATECTLNLQMGSQFAVKLTILTFVTFLAIITVFWIFGYKLSVKSLRELSERRKMAIKEGNYSPFRDPVIWITWVISISTGLLIALFMGLI